LPILVVIFSIVEYFIPILQINFDAKIKNVSDLKSWDKLSFRNFKFNLYDWNLLDEVEVDEKIKAILLKQNSKYVEVFETVPFGLFIIIWIWYFVIKFLFL